MTDAANLPSPLAPEPRALKHRPQAAWRERNQLKVWGHKAVESALRRGLLERRPCEERGDPNSEAHHPDHRNALDVKWLCRKHHEVEHARENAAQERAGQAAQERAA